MTLQIDTHLSDIERYCADVESGDRPACLFERQAIARHRDDFLDSESGKISWIFDPIAASRAIDFIQRFSHIKGTWASQRGKSSRIHLEPWQKFIVGSIFGWVDPETGLRRYLEAYIEIPRKNAKSTLAAVIGLYCMSVDREPGAEIYCGATTQRQALEVFKPAKLMALKQPFWRRHYAVSVNASNMTRPDGSVYAPVVGRPGDGASPHCAILDERHEHVDNALYDTMATGMAAREQPLLLSITTAGSNLEGPCHHQRRDVLAVLSGEKRNDRLFGVIYTIDDEEKWDTLAALKMANPNFGVSVFAENLIHQQQQAKEDPARAAIFKTKHLNIWVGAMTAWMNMTAWHAAQTETPRAELAYIRNVSALDLGSIEDLSVRLDLYQVQDDNGDDHYYSYPTIWVPQSRAEDPRNKNQARYLAWIDAGYIIATPGDIISHKTIEDDTLQHVLRYAPDMIGFDKWNSTYLSQRLRDDHGQDVVEIPMTSRVLSAPMKWIAALVQAGRLHHDGNPCFDWMMSNVVATEDRNENLFPNKENRHSKIDGPVTLIMAMAMMLEQDTETANIDGFLES